MAIIRKNIMALFYMVCFVGFIILSILIYVITTTTYQEYMVEQENLNKVSFTSLNSIFLQYESTLDVIGNQLIKNDNYKFVENSREILDSILSLNPTIVAFGLTNSNGEFYATSSNLNNINKLENLAKKEVTKKSFELTLRSKVMVIGRTYYHKRLNSLIIPIRKAIRDKHGNVLAVMTAGLNLEKAFGTVQETSHRHVIFRGFDNFNQLTENRDSNMMYEKPISAIFVSEIFQKVEKKYKISIEEVKEREKLVSIKHKRFNDDTYILTTAKYLKRYDLWNVTQIYEKVILHKIIYKAVLLLIIFIGINVVMFLLFRSIHKNEEQKQKSLFYQATHDSLTNLYNRHFLSTHFSNLESFKPFTLLFIDIDNFKAINDAYGHTCGDQVLKEIASRISFFKKEESFLVRHSGDEFLLITDEINKTEIEILATNIIEKLGKPYLIDQYQFIIGASIGISQYPVNGDTFDDIKRYADFAMYEAKNEKNTFKFFEDSIKEKYLRRLAIEQELRSAIDRNEIYMMYQPQVDNKNRLYGVEALVRWENKKLGLISPDEFISIAESTGQMISIGKHIIKTTLYEIQEIQQEIKDSSFQTSINISVKQFMKIDFIEELFSLIQESKINKLLITLEITESIFIDDFDYILTLLKALKDKNIKLSLDDFGTGYSSLSMLKKLPIDELKIDKAFVDDILSDEDSKNMAQSIISIGKQFNMTVLAEGIEKVEQKELLNQMGCDLYQGYYFSKPIRKDALKSFVLQGRD